jgi:hypothetical protein
VEGAAFAAAAFDAAAFAAEALGADALEADLVGVAAIRFLKIGIVARHAVNE